MPNGYTAKLYDGEPQTMQEFVLDAARNFGFLIQYRDHGRDYDWRADLPFRADTYYDEASVAEAAVRIATLEHMTDDELYEEYGEYLAKTAEANESYRASRKAIRERYEAMREQLIEWEVDPHIQSIKDGMIRMVDESIEFDCGDRDDTPFTPMRLQEWYDNEIEYNERRITNGQQRIREARERAAERTKYATLLLDSLGL